MEEIRLYPKFFAYLSKHRMRPYFTALTCIALLILIPLFISGYLFSLDMAFAEDLTDKFVQPPFGWLNWQNGLSSRVMPSVSYFISFYILSVVFPVWFLEKILLFSFILLSGMGAFVLLRENEKAALLAGIFYMANPFIYTRFLAGNVFLLFGYAVLPFFIFFLVKSVEAPSIRNAIALVFLSSLLGIAEHFIPIGLFFLVLFSLFNRSRIRFFTVVFGMYLTINLYWILPLFVNGFSNSFSSFIGESTLSLYSSKQAIDANLFFSLASLHGFWRGGYLYAKDFIPGWQLLYVFILFLTVYGFVTHKNDKTARIIGFMGLIGLLLAAGASNQYTGPVFMWLFDHILFFKGYREPQKLVALVVLAYAYLGGLGVSSLERDWNRTKNRIYPILIAAALLTPIIYTFPMFFGFWGQLQPTDYPLSWYEADQILKADPQETNLLFLPWHQYMDFSWVKNKDKRIANPAQVFFSKPVIQGDNVEAGGVYSTSANPTSKYVEFLLANKNNYTNLGELLSLVNVKYVALAKEVDWQQYLFLYNQSDLELVYDSPELALFRNRHQTYKLYSTDSKSYIPSFDALLQASQYMDVLDTVWVLGNRTSISPSTHRSVEYARTSQVSYQIGGNSGAPEGKYLVFTSNFNKDWLLDEQQPAQNFGVTSYYNMEEGTLSYAKFRLYLLGYLISGLSFIFLLLLYFGKLKLPKKLPGLESHPLPS